MIQADIGNDTQVGLYDVGAIQASAHTRFNDGYLYVLIAQNNGKPSLWSARRKRGVGVRRMDVVLLRN